MRSSANTLKDIASNLVCYFRDIEEYDQKAIDKFIGGSSEILIDIKVRLMKLNDWEESSLDNVLAEYRTEKERSVPKVNQPIRISLTGSTKSPGLGLTLSIFTKNRAIERINKLLDKLS